MKKNHHLILLPLFVFVVFLISGLIQTPVFGAKAPKKVAILPFTMNADRDLSFLQTGILDMLTTRLMWKDKVEVMEKGIVKQKVSEYQAPFDREKALAIGKALGADYVILGSLTIFGESVSIDAKIFDVTKSDELLAAFNQTKGMDAVIPTVNQFALDINSKILGRRLAPRSYVRMPSERYRQAGPSGLIRVKQDFWKKQNKRSSKINAAILGMDIGDVDGDGKNELVCIGQKALHIYRYVEGTFAQTIKIKGAWSANYVWVDVADLNGNGRAEIYVSNLTMSGADSFVLEWDKGQYRKLVSGLSWFLRVMRHPVEGDLLIGQKRYVDMGLTKDMHILKLENGQIVDEGKTDMLPGRANVFNFAVGYITGEEKLNTALLSKNDNLFLFDEEGEELWRSSEPLGGSLLYQIDNVALPKNLHFTPRVLLTDLNQDGQIEVAVCNNTDTLRGLTENIRMYKNGELRFLTWDGLTLSTAVKTIKFSGAVTAYQIRDVDNDGQDELVVISVKEGWQFMSKGGKSIVVILELGDQE